MIYNFQNFLNHTFATSLLQSNIKIISVREKGTTKLKNK